MKFLVDQDVYIATARFLAELGHDVVRTAELGLAQWADADLLRLAAEEGRIFVTRDRDYGSLVFVNFLGSGVLYLRMPPPAQEAEHKELARVLSRYSENALMSAFVVVEANGHRFRQLRAK